MGVHKILKLRPQFFFPGSLKIELFTALISTVFAVWVLHMMFSDKKEDSKSDTFKQGDNPKKQGPYDEKDSQIHPEVRHYKYRDD